MAINTTSTDVWADLGLGKPQEQVKRQEEVGQEQFLELMLAQMKNQDPLKPMENGEFLTQIAQFSSAKGISQMGESIEALTASLTSNQALQASSLIGRTVLVPGNVGYLEEGSSGMGGAVNLPSSTTDLKVTVTDMNGAPIKTINMGAKSAGTEYFVWDGTDEAGNPVAPGSYQINAEALVDGEPLAVESLVASRVESVTMGKGGQGITLNLAGLGALNFNEVQEIM